MRVPAACSAAALLAAGVLLGVQLQAQVVDDGAALARSASLLSESAARLERVAAAVGAPPTPPPGFGAPPPPPDGGARARAHLKRERVVEELRPLQPKRGGEGSSIIAQRWYFTDLLFNLTSVRTVLQVGFNLGVGAAAFLSARPDVTVVSFDLGKGAHVGMGERIIRQHFGAARHTLILGDSTETVPKHARDTRAVYDLIWIDGGHDYAVASADYRSSKMVSTADTLVAIDDLVPAANFGEGPSRVWREGLAAGDIVPVDFVQVSAAPGPCSKGNRLHRPRCDGWAVQRLSHNGSMTDPNARRAWGLWKWGGAAVLGV